MVECFNSSGSLIFNQCERKLQTKIYHDMKEFDFVSVSLPVDDFIHYLCVAA